MAVFDKDMNSMIELQIAIFPTTNSSILYKTFGNKFQTSLGGIPVKYNNSEGHTSQHIYLISDEEIKSGDYFIRGKSNQINQYVPEEKNVDRELSKVKSNIARVFKLSKYDRKIVSSTNEYIDLPQLSYEFTSACCRFLNKKRFPIYYDEIINDMQLRLIYVGTRI